jgi:hypothetical protein
VIGRLAERFPTLERAHVAEIVNEEWRNLDAGRVRDFVPILVEHEARVRLRSEAAPTPFDVEAESASGVPRDEPLELDPMEIEARNRQTGVLLGDIDS